MGELWDSVLSFGLSALEWGNMNLGAGLLLDLEPNFKWRYIPMWLFTTDRTPLYSA